MNRLLWLTLAICACAVEACAHHPAPSSERARADLARGAMISLPGGRFVRQHGSGPFSQDPTHVSVGPFLLDAAEVTVAAYSECVRAGGCKPAWPTVSWQSIGAADRARWSPFCNQDRGDRADHPVNCVDWHQATSYCAWAGKRLPSEEEWEWAARNGAAGTQYPWGSAPPASQPCWNGPGSDAEGKRDGTCPAASHPADATAAGVKDLGGDVSEWTTSETVMGADSRGRGGTTVKVARGGGWPDQDPSLVSIAARLPDLPSRRDARLGFRCASAP
jgi:formylglycine-generating enzyme required for sulfatase activity